MNVERWGRSREPLVLTSCSGTNDKAKVAGGGAHAKAAPLQALGNGTSYERANPVEDEGEDEYEEDLAATSPG